jgi:hypothetical protein
MSLRGFATGVVTFAMVSSVAGVALVPGTARAASRRPAAAGGVAVGVDRTRISAVLGDHFVFRATVVNRGTAPATGLIAHLNVLSLRPGLYVDPEDWSADRTKYLGTLPPGGSRTLTWRLQAVAPGRLGIYVAVLAERAAGAVPVAAPAVHVAIAERRTLNAGGIVPVALGVPALLGALALVAGVWRPSDRR